MEYLFCNHTYNIDCKSNPRIFGNQNFNSDLSNHKLLNIIMHWNNFCSQNKNHLLKFLNLKRIWWS